MNAFSLIDYVVPSGGFYCVVGMDEGGPLDTRLTQDRAEVDRIVEQFVQQNKHVYFALSKFKTDQNRTADNAEALQAVWVDIDCGEAKANEIEESTGLPKGYVDKATASMALKKFCDTVGLPVPAIIDSGNGLHAYWALTEEVPRDRWSPIADRLKQVCVTQKFCADPRVFDVSRILRVPGSFNQKSQPAREVKVLRPSTTRVTPDALREILGVASDAVDAVKPKRELSVLQKLLDQNTDNSFKRILVKKDSCLQLRDCLLNRATLSEPRWFNALSIAKFCEDGDVAIHRLSEGHPDYNHNAVERKIVGIKGPHSCLEFEKNNQGGCEGCPHKGKITSPISLGKVLAPAKAVKANKYPSGYTLGEKGGVYYTGGEDVELVYRYDFYLDQVMVDPEDGDVGVFKVHTAHNGVREFTIKFDCLGQKELQQRLAKYGIIGHRAQHKLLTDYVINALLESQDMNRAKLMRVQLGWADNDSKFIVGEREITVDGCYHSPASSITESYAPHFAPKGSYAKWQEVFNIYNRPGLEVQAFAALSGFGAPLLKLTGQKGALINLVHKHAGTGKTTVLRMANSICGDPENLLGTPDDTMVGRINKLGVFNSIVNTMDELTNMEDKEVGRFAYACSQGKGKERGQAAINANRKNLTTWRTITLTTSNSSLYQKLQHLKGIPDGELMRIIEFVIEYQDVSIVSTAEGKEMFDHQLNANYGHAIVPFMQHVIANIDAVRERIKSVQSKIDSELNLTQRERNWSAIIAANITAGMIATELGIINFDMRRIYKNTAPILSSMRDDTVAPIDSNAGNIGEFINRNLIHTLVVESGNDRRSGRVKAPQLEPRGSLYIRIEPDTNRMYVSVSRLRDDFDKNGIDYKSFVKELTAAGMILETKNFHLGKGFVGASTATRSIVFDTAHPEFGGRLDAKVFVPLAEELHESGESDLPD